MSSGGSSREPGSLDVEALLVRSGVPGCSVAVLDGGEVVFERGFGSTRSDEGLPVGRATRMPACSMSKPVAVVAALRLVEQGLLDLDADVSDYLTRWVIPANGDWRPRITLRQLASHTAGLTAHNGFPGYRQGEAVPSLVEVLSGVHPANAPGVRVDLVPGIQFRYSGAGTTLIQLLLEEVTGKDAVDLLAELVLDPLEMHDSTSSQSGDVPERAHGHRLDGEPVPGGWHVQPEVCAAGLWTTPGDYLSFLRGMQGALAGVPGSLLGPSLAHEMLTPVAALPFGRDMIGMGHVGLGFFLAVRDGATTWFGHTGSNTGFVCASLASTSGGRAAVVMLNSDSGTAAARSLVQQIVTRWEWTDAGVDLHPAADRPTGIPSHAGTYVREDGMRVVLADGVREPQLLVPRQDAIRLTIDDAATLSTEALDLRVLLGNDGSITLDQGGQRTVLQRAEDRD
jgi:CubicO group peptidase (beta-lactamase class C family)